MPEGFTVHPSQVQVDEGEEAVIPSWRKEQIKAREAEEQEMLQALPRAVPEVKCV